MISRRTLLLAPVVLAGCRPPRGTGFEGHAFVANEEGRAIAAVDLTAFHVAKYVRIPGKPTAVLAHPGRPVVYALTPEDGTVYEIGSGDLALHRRVRVAQHAGWMRLSPDGQSLWVLATTPSQLVRIKVDSFAADSRIPLDGVGTDLDLASQGPRRAAVAFSASGSFSFVDLEAHRAVAPVQIGQALSFVRFRSDGRQLLVGNLGERSLSIHSAPSGRTVVRLPLGIRPDNICMKSDGGQAFISGEGMDAVAIVYPYSTEVAETMLAGRNPGAMSSITTADRDYLFVANPSSRDVTIIDIETRRAIAVVSVGGEPVFITATPDNQYALVLGRSSGTMGVIRVGAITATRARSAALFTLIPVGSKPVSAAVRGV